MIDRRAPSEKCRAACPGGTAGSRSANPSEPSSMVAVDKDRFGGSRGVGERVTTLLRVARCDDCAGQDRDEDIGVAPPFAATVNCVADQPSKGSRDLA